MRRLRIVHTESSKGWGGQEWRIFLELRWMALQGHLVWLVAPRDSRIYAECVKVGIPVVDFAFSRLDWTWGLCRLICFFKHHRIDVVNTHSSRDAWLGGVAARLAQVPLIIRSRHIEVEYRSRFLARVAFEALPDYVLTTSQRIVDRLVAEQGINPQRLECLPTGVDVSRFSPRSSGPVLKELGLPESTPLVGMISVLRSWKGHDDFIVAAKLFLERSPSSPVHFVIAGEGPCQASIRAKIESSGLTDRVHMLGYRGDVPDVLASLAVLILPSYAHEGVPQIVLQAQAMARPVIGTRIGGIPEVIRDGETGWLVPPRDPVALADTLRRVLEAPGLAAEAGRRAFERISQFHTLDVMGRELEKIYGRYLY